MIKVVCEQSQVDFEEGGVDESTLKLLKSVWLHHSLPHHLLMLFSFAIDDMLRTASYNIICELVVASARAGTVKGGEEIDLGVARAGQGRHLFWGEVRHITHFYNCRCLICASPRYAIWGYAVPPAALVTFSCAPLMLMSRFIYASSVLTPI